MEPESFESVFATHGALVWAIITRTGIPQRDADDLFMEVWERVSEHLPSYGGRAKLSTWIGGIARNRCIDYLRKRRPQPSVGLEAVDRGVDPGAADWLRQGRALHTRSPRERAIAGEEKRFLDKAMKGLPPSQRTIAALWMAGLSYRDIAAALNAGGADPIDTAYVGKQLYLARERLRKALRAAGVGPMKDFQE